LPVPPQQNAHAFLDTVFENLPIMVFVKDATNLRFVSVNQATEDLLGYSRDDLIGKSDYDFFPKDQADFFTSNDRRVFEGGMPVDIPEEPIETKERGRRILHTKKVPIFGPDGSPQYLLGISEDITELYDVQNRLRESEHKMRGLLEAMPDLIFLLDRAGRFLSHVPAKGIQTIAPPEQFIGKSLADIMPPAVAEIAQENLDRAFAEQLPQTFEYELILEGEERFYEARIVPGNLDDAITVVRDVSDRKKAEARVRQHQAELAHAGRISSMGEMATGIAHELNQPLAALRTHAEACVLDIEAGNADPTSLLEDLNIIAAQAERATQIIRRLRNFLRKGSIDAEEFHLNEVVSTAIEFGDHDARDGAVEIESVLIEREIRIQGDPIQIQQVVINLLRNSIEAVAEFEGPSVVHLSTSMGEDMAEIRIHNNGPTVSAETVEGYFTPYFTTKAQGLGLGLSISKSIMENHGGELVGFPDLRGGVTFLITIPIVQEEDQDG